MTAPQRFLQGQVGGDCGDCGAAGAADRDNDDGGGDGDDESDMICTTVNTVSWKTRLPI